ncbi:TetR/AcrR family transcriptional regulator [Nocardioides plantarum]|uniref:TetR/AcrR family transcriptional regulator n=1 Tax=Nocardioides plantarum TaxID=29299 RepID=A0ABV5KI70_9ACTN|nr:helix-turn-helix domain-containing protein [Nocardioides plantarum]
MPETTTDDVRARIVDAAARLLRDEGARAVTTRAVAQAASVQAPTIYRLFGDKDGLVEAVAEHVMATYVGAKQAAVAGAADADVDPVTDLRDGWRLHVEFGMANPDLYALLSSVGRPQPSPATRAGIEVLRARVRRLAAAGLLRVDEERALGLIHAAGTGTVIALLETPADQRDLGLVDAAYDAVAAAILVDEPARPDDARPTTAAVTLAAVLPELPGLSEAERALMAEWLTRSVALLRS